MIILKNSSFYYTTCARYLRIRFLTDHKWKTIERNVTQQAYREYYNDSFLSDTRNEKLRRTYGSSGQPSDMKIDRSFEFKVNNGLGASGLKCV